MGIKLKKIIKEAAWDHQSGKALPTLADVQAAYTAKQGKKINESDGYIETIDGDNSVSDALQDIYRAWNRWSDGPATEPQHVRPAKDELLKFVQKWLSKKIR